MHNVITDHVIGSVEIKTFNPKSYPILIETLENYTKNLIDDHRFIDNYKNINFYDYEYVSIMSKNDTIIGFSSTWNREYFGKDCVRILNRYYQDPILNRNNMGFIKNKSRFMAEIVRQQTTLLAKNYDFKYVFISRERCKRWFKALLDELTTKTGYEFFLTSDKLRVAPDWTDSCYQYVGFAPIKFKNDIDHEADFLNTIAFSQ